MASQSLLVEGLSKSFQGFHALRDIRLEVRGGELVSILGPSGCGKSTLLRAIAGLDDADRGRIEIGGQSVAELAPKDREVAFVFQSYALYPHLTSRQNIAAPLVMRELSFAERLPFASRLSRKARGTRARIAERVANVAELLQVEALLDRRPSQLSGGQRQRVALGRALIREPKLFLLDEPLANLDSALRNQTRSELRALQRRLGTTTLFVTHDQAEAMAISDRIAVMFSGEVRQIGTPDDLFRHPVDLEVARFMSQPHLNVLRGVDAVEAMAKFPPRKPASPDSVIAFRAEHCRLFAGREANGLAAVVETVEHAGQDALIYARTEAGGALCLAKVPSTDVSRWYIGKSVSLAVNVDAAWRFDDALSQAVAARPALAA